jgi:S1-C subfamily serine protease
MNRREHFFEELIGWIQQDQAETAIENLLNFLKGSQDKENYDTIILVSARYHRLSKETSQGVITRQDAQIERSRIDQALLETIARLEKTLLSPIFPAAGPGLSPDTSLPGFAYEKIIGPRSTIKKIAWLEKGMKAQESVCRIVNSGYATGFLTPGGWMFTNHHVIPDAEEAKRTTVQFNYNEDIRGKLLKYFTYSLDVSTFYTDESLDFTRVKVQEAPDLPPLTQWGQLDLTDKLPGVGDHVTIIQHPSGGPKQIALNENRVTNIYRHYLQYTTDTLPGSSGSPVFNDDWEVVALHHAGGHLKTNDKGDIRFINQAAAMKYLLAGLDT